MKLEEQDVKRVYTAGMNLANQLRLIGKHDEAHQIEVWILSLCEDLRKQHETNT
jgi:hypothetical protein